LGDIPYLGALFRRTIKDKSKTELLIFLTPLVVENPVELHAVTKSEKDNSSLAPKAFTKDQMDQFLKLPAVGKDESNGGGLEPATPESAPVHEK
jgi:type II secretory pathway component GspD/PulD (secretin)